jgi:hypothetical protein
VKSIIHARQATLRTVGGRPLRSHLPVSLLPLSRVIVSVQAQSAYNQANIGLRRFFCSQHCDPAASGHRFLARRKVARVGLVDWVIEDDSDGRNPL